MKAQWVRIKKGKAAWRHLRNRVGNVPEHVGLGEDGEGGVREEDNEESKHASKGKKKPITKKNRRVQLKNKGGGKYV